MVLSAIVGQVSYADVTLHFSPQVLIAGETVEVTISLSANEPNVAVGAIGFDYDINSEAWAALNPSAFHWVRAAFLLVAGRFHIAGPPPGGEASSS